MPALSKDAAAERLAAVVEKSRETQLAEIYAENFPEQPTNGSPSASDLAEHIRRRCEAEEILDLWNVVFPGDHNVWYDEEEDKVRYNEQVVAYPDAD